MPELSNASFPTHLIIPGVGRMERNRNHTVPLEEEPTGTVILESNLAVLVKFGMTHPSWSVPEKLSHSPHGTGVRCSSQDLAEFSLCLSTGTREENMAGPMARRGDAAPLTS